MSAPSWEDCAAAGMSVTEAAAARGRTTEAGRQYARRHGLVFKDGRWNAQARAAAADNMRRLHADPVFAAQRNARWAALRQARWDDPRARAAAAEAMRQRMLDPARNPLVHLSAAERAEYDRLKYYRFTRAEALRAIGRPDLVRESAE